MDIILWVFLLGKADIGGCRTTDARHAHHVAEREISNELNPGQSSGYLQFSSAQRMSLMVLRHESVTQLVVVMSGSAGSQADLKKVFLFVGSVPSPGWGTNSNDWHTIRAQAHSMYPTMRKVARA